MKQDKTGCESLRDLYHQLAFQLGREGIDLYLRPAPHDGWQLIALKGDLHAAETFTPHDIGTAGIDRIIAETFLLALSRAEAHEQ